MTLFVIFYPYHLVRTILSMPFCLYTILDIEFENVQSLDFKDIIDLFSSIKAHDIWYNRYHLLSDWQRDGFM